MSPELFPLRSPSVSAVGAEWQAVQMGRVATMGGEDVDAGGDGEVQGVEGGLRVGFLGGSRRLWWAFLLVFGWPKLGILERFGWLGGRDD